MPAPCLTCDMSWLAPAVPAGAASGGCSPARRVTPLPGQRDGCVDGAVPGAPQGAAHAGGEYSGHGAVPWGTQRCCALPGCEHSGTVSWDTRGCCAVAGGKHWGPGSDHSSPPCLSFPNPTRGQSTVRRAPQGLWVPKEETWGSARRAPGEQGAGVSAPPAPWGSWLLAAPGPEGPCPCPCASSHTLGASPGLKDALRGETEAQGKQSGVPCPWEGWLRPATLRSCVAGPGRVKGSSGPELSRCQRKPDMR